MARSVLVSEPGTDLREHLDEIAGLKRVHIIEDFRGLEHVGREFLPLLAIPFFVPVLRDGAPPGGVVGGGDPESGGRVSVIIVTLKWIMKVLFILESAKNA